MNTIMYRNIFFVCAGYLSGSILYAPLLGNLLCHRDITENSSDHNPGTANAFMQGGFLCGLLTLMCELAKAFLPVHLYLKEGPPADIWLALVMAAPVAGHVFPIFRRFSGGIGIAASFGSLLGLFPYLNPLMILVLCYIIFSVIFVITPHYYRTLVTYLVVCIIMPAFVAPVWIRVGILLITAFVAGKLLANKPEEETCKVRLLWKS